MGKISKKRSFKQFAKDKNIEISVQRYLIDALSYMALGLFASLLIGTIFNTLGDKLNISLFTEGNWSCHSSGNCLWTSSTSFSYVFMCFSWILW